MYVLGGGETCNGSKLLLSSQTGWATRTHSKMDESINSLPNKIRQIQKGYVLYDSVPRTAPNESIVRKSGKWLSRQRIEGGDCLQEKTLRNDKVSCLDCNDGFTAVSIWQTPQTAFEMGVFYYGKIIYQKKLTGKWTEENRGRLELKMTGQGWSVLWAAPTKVHSLLWFGSQDAPLLWKTLSCLLVWTKYHLQLTR